MPLGINKKGTVALDMHWLKQLFTPKKQPVSAASPTHTVFRLGDDESHNANADILEGVQFAATLHITTPYAVLIHHGEVFAGPPSKAPTYGNQAQGIWIPKTKSWRSFGIDLPEMPQSEHATDIGPKHPESYLPFLLDFRRIFEGNDADEMKIEKLRLLVTHTEDYASIWKRLEAVYQDFPRNLFYRSFLDLPGVGRTTARNLYEAGFHSVEQIQNTEPSELQKVRGVGPGLAKKMTSNAGRKAGK
ncbi:MAG: helix-hairpin-helix domain-containing protein [Deltaproteobacteria bacterium]|nr:helix-hairpin-helix domain-containing protein [Deltaproteobacteria bacterium]